MNIEFANEDAIACNEDEIVDLASFALRRMGIHDDSQLDITVVDEDRMSELHVQWMDLPGPTDVLSFPMDELRPFDPEPGMVGDIVLCPAFASTQAVNHPLETELQVLTVHGVLHLLGYDHAEPDEEKAMFALQDEILGEWRAKR